MLEEGKIKEEFAFEPVEEEEEGAPAEAFPDSEYAAVFEGVEEEPVAVVLDSEDIVPAVEDLVGEARKTQQDQQIVENMDDDSYAALADWQVGRRRLP